MTDQHPPPPPGPSGVSQACPIPGCARKAGHSGLHSMWPDWVGQAIVIGFLVIVAAVVWFVVVR